MAIALKQLFNDPKVAFVAARKFTMSGRDYKPGDVVPNNIIRDVRNREAILRSHRVIPVVGDLNDLPRAFRKDVKDRALTFKKLRATDPAASVPGGTGSDSQGTGILKVSGMTVHEAKEYLGNRLGNVGAWAHAILDEQINNEQPRITLLEWVMNNLSGATGLTMDEFGEYTSDPANYTEGMPLYEFRSTIEG